MKKAATKKTAAKTTAPAPEVEASTPVTQTADTPPPEAEVEPSASALRCARSFRHGGALYERGKLYDVPKDTLKAFAHRFVDSRADL